jgi:hypothetical protein
MEASRAVITLQAQGMKKPYTPFEMMSVTDEHWPEPGYRELKVKNPTSRNEREKWGTQRARKLFLDDLSNPVRPFDYIVKAGQTARPNAVRRRRP